MAQKAPVDENLKTPPPVKIESLAPKEETDHLKGVRPYIDAPEAVIKRATRNSIILVLLTAVISAGILYFAWRQISKLATSLQSKQNLIYLTGQQNQTSAELERQWAEISPNIPKIEAMLPSSNDLLGYMGELEKIAKDSGVQQTIKFQNQNQSTKTNLPGQTNQNTKKESSVEYTIELKGSFDQIISYLSSLEKAPYFTKIISFNMTTSQNTDKENISTATIGAKVFTYQ